MRFSRPDSGFDALDYKILGALSEHGFMKNTELAELVGLSSISVKHYQARILQERILERNSFASVASLGVAD